MLAGAVVSLKETEGHAGSSPFSHLARTREWPNPNHNPKNHSREVRNWTRPGTRALGVGARVLCALQRLQNSTFLCILAQKTLLSLTVLLVMQR